jgi:hypothetical protein
VRQHTKEVAATIPTRATKVAQSHSGPVDFMLELQRTLGNQTVARMVTRAAVPPAQDHPVAGLGGEGQMLDDAVRRSLEPRFGLSFADVRIHTDSAASRLAEASGAAALTIGRDVFFGTDAYAPNSAAGRRLLAHELTHIAQYEKYGTPAAGSASPLSRCTDGAEREAEAAADRVAAGGRAQPLHAAPAAVVSRSPLDWLEEKASDAWGGVTDAASTVGSVASDAASAVYSGMKSNAALISEGEELAGQGIDWLEDKEKAGTQWLVRKTADIPIVKHVVKGAAAVADLGTEAAGGGLRGATGLVGGLATVAADPVDTAIGLEAMAEHVPIVPGVPNPLKAAHGLLDVATGKQTWDQFESGQAPLTSAEEDARYWTAVGQGLIGQYSKQMKQGKYVDVAGHALFDIASLFAGAGEANAASKLGGAARLARTAELAELAKAAELTKAAELAKAADVAKLGEVADAARLAEAGDLAKATDAARLLKAPKVGNLEGMKIHTHGTPTGELSGLREAEIDAAIENMEAEGFVQGGETYYNDAAMKRQKSAYGANASKSPRVKTPKVSKRPRRPDLGVSAKKVEGAVKESKKALKDQGISGGLSPARYGDALHRELARAAERLLGRRLKRGTEFFNDKPLREIRHMPKLEAELTAREWLELKGHPNPGLSEEMLGQQVGLMQPDLVFREPGGAFQMIDLTSQPNPEHLAKSIFYTLVLGTP